jgi:hypothetical protein
VSAPEQGFDLAEVVRILMSIGVEESCARAQFTALDDEAARLREVGALAVESDAGLLLSPDLTLAAALFELVDALRQSGLAVSVGETAGGALAVAFQGPRPSVYELHIEPAATHRDLLRALAQVVPRTHQLLLVNDYECGGALPVVVLDRGTHVAFSAALGADGAERVFARAAGDAPRVRLTLCEAGVQEPDFVLRFGWRTPESDGAPSLEEAFERVRGYDPRVAWPAHSSRPPGDRFLEYGHALAGRPLAACLSGADTAAWANLMYRFALATLVGASCDLLAARRNPGRSAQGLLGFGQLTWAYFIFDALGATDDAARAGALLDHPWVRCQERGSVYARQRAYYDLAEHVRSGARSPALRCLAELVALLEPSAWLDDDAVRAALEVHTEPLGDQLTHQPLHHVWPAPLYALARRAGADIRPLYATPFLAHPLRLSDVDPLHPHVVRFKEQLAGFDALDPERLPPLLDPLPVIVDVQITAVDGAEAHGRTLLTPHDDAEHHVVAPIAGRDIKPGEIWLLEVQGARPSATQAHYADLGDVSVAIALPTGEWLSKA